MSVWPVKGMRLAAHHHVLRPLIGSLAMVPFCFWLKEVSVPAAVAAGAVVYVVVTA